MLRFVKLLSVVVYLFSAIGVSAQNPFLAPTAFIPDGEPHVFTYKGETRVYVYGSRDERITGYCGYGHDVWSAPLTDLTKWTCHGEIFNVKQVFDIGYGKVNEQHFGAPDCAYNPITKRYYLYTFLGAEYKMDGTAAPLASDPNVIVGYDGSGPKCVMAQSDSPMGPFVDPVMCDWPAANKAGTFDPAVLVDKQKDGSIKVYAYWGMRRGDRWAELDPTDMHTIINSQTSKPDRNAIFRTLPENPEEFNHSTLFEASSIRRVAKDRYVFIYSPNEGQPKLTYCFSNSPRGPWKFGGVIVNNSIGWAFGNNHGSIFEAKGQWYVVYHRSSTNDASRQAMMEPIDLRIKGDSVIIREVEMTSQGVRKEGLDPFQRYNAGIMCWHTPGIYVDGAKRNKNGLNPIVNINAPSASIGFKYFNFGKKECKGTLSVMLNVALYNKTSFKLQSATPDQANDPESWKTLCSVQLEELMPMDGEYRKVMIPVEQLSPSIREVLKGKLAIFMTFEGENGELCRIKELEFCR